MNFVGYIDESDTHGATPNVVMSAMLSTEGRWERCSRDLARIKDKFGFTVFHATEFRALRGDFAGWPPGKCFDLFMEFGRLGATYLTESFVISLPYATYKSHFLDCLPSRMHRTSQYGICFMGVLDGMMRKVMDHGPQSKLSIIVEDGHKNVNDIGRLFEDRKKRLETGNIDLLRSYNKGTKESCPLLQLADITAHAHAQEKRAVKSGAAPDFGERNEHEPERGQPGWTVYEVTADYLAGIINEFDSDRVAAQEEYLRKRKAWQEREL